MFLKYISRNKGVSFKEQIKLLHVIYMLLLGWEVRPDLTLNIENRIQA
jgi:hypothetical protein